LVEAATTELQRR